MSHKEIRNIFGSDITTYALIENKKIQHNLCTFSSITEPNFRRHSLSDEIKEKIISFYLDDDISRIMPGSQNYITIGEKNDRQQIQKRLLLSTLRESYLQFRKRFPGQKIGFDKFSELRPKQCILLGIGNQQNVCVCTLHQNMKLMFEQSQLKKVNVNGKILIAYKDLINCVICDSNEERKCSVSMCDTCCSNLVNLEKQMLENFEQTGLVEIKYKKWSTTDRCNLDTLIVDPETFTEQFISHLKILIPHHFISFQQSQFLKENKQSLQLGEFLVQLDFAENYSFFVQDAVQGYHWNNTQSTIHPFVIYYKSDDILQHKSFVIISNCSNHDSIAVHLFINKMIKFLKEGQRMMIKKIFFVSDGAGAQYKNKYNFINLCNFKADFQIDAEWHFHATSHGKSACDGIGGTLKRAAHRFSLANKDTIQTSADLYNWASNSFSTSMSFEYSTEEEYVEMKKKIKDTPKQSQ